MNTGTQLLRSYDGALAAAEDAGREQNGKDSADDDRGRGLIVEAEGLEGILGVEGCKHIVADNIGQDKDNGKNNAQPALLERVLHVVRGAAVVAAVGILVLIDLREG